MVDDKELEEKEYYRKRLRQWRDLGFDTRELELMLDQDFEHFKEMSMEKLRSQLHLMSSEETIPKDKVAEQAKAAAKATNRSQRPFITEYDDIRKENEDEKEDALLEIRKEMTRRKQLEDTGVRDLEDDREFARPKQKVHEPDEDYPLISFNPARGKVPTKGPAPKTTEEPASSSTLAHEMDLFEEEARIKRKRRELEEEEARLRRRRRLMLGTTEAKIAPETAESGPAEEEDALIFVDKNGNGETEEEEPEEESPEEPSSDEHVRLTVDHDRKAEEPEEAQEVEALPPTTLKLKTKNIKKGLPPTKPKTRPVQGVVKKAPVVVKKSPVVVKKAPTVVKRTTVPMKKGTAPVKKAKPVKPMVKKQKKKWNPFGILVIVMVAIIVLASLVWYSNVIPTISAVAKVSNSQITIGQDVTFTGNGSKSTGTITSYVWDFGDKTPHVGGKIVHHIYSKAGSFNATLTVKSDTGLSKSTTVSVHVSHLIVRPPSKMIGDKATYNTKGWAKVDGDIYTFKNPVPIGGMPSEIKIDHIDLNYNGPMTSSILNQTSQEDGFSVIHNVLHREVVQNLQFTGEATTNVASAPVNIKGKENMDQHVYVDLKTNQTVKTVLSSSLVTDPITFQGITLSKGLSSKDDLRTYPDLASVDSQVSVEDLFADRSLNTGDPTTVNGQVTKGQSPDIVTYSWRYNGTDNIFKRSAIHLNVTIDASTMNRLGLNALFVDIWITNDLPTYVKMHTYIDGKSGNDTYKADNLQEMSAFTAGTTKITGTCNAIHYDAVHPLAYFAAFNMTPLVGDATQSSEKFSPREALLAALNFSADFRSYMGSGSPYAITGNYSEKTGPTWNITYGKKGETDGRDVIVTMTGKGTYTVIDKQVSNTAPTINRDDILSVVTLSAAENIFRSDAKTAQMVFSGSKVDYSKANWLLNADTPYPNLDFTLTSISATEIKYTYFISKPSTSTQSGYNVALNAMDGQLMFAEEHSGSVPIP